MKDFLKRIGSFFKKIFDAIARAWPWPKIEQSAKELLNLAAFFGLITSETRDRLVHGIDAGEELVLDGIAKFENIKLDVVELIGALKMLLADVFPNDDDAPVARGFQLVAADDIDEPSFISGARPGAPGAHLARSFKFRSRGIGTDEFIEICTNLKNEALRR